jgi:hypothetical protein
MYLVNAIYVLYVTIVLIVIKAIKQTVEKRMIRNENKNLGSNSISQVRRCICILCVWGGGAE